MNRSTLSLGGIVTAALIDNGISEREAAERTNIPRSTLRRHLQTGDFRMNELAAIATVLGVTVSELTHRAEAAA